MSFYNLQSIKKAEYSQIFFALYQNPRKGKGKPDTKKGLCKQLAAEGSRGTWEKALKRKCRAKAAMDNSSKKKVENKDKKNSYNQPCMFFC